MSLDDGTVKPDVVSPSLDELVTPSARPGRAIDTLKAPDISNFDRAGASKQLASRYASLQIPPVPSKQKLGSASTIAQRLDILEKLTQKTQSTLHAMQAVPAHDETACVPQTVIAESFLLDGYSGVEQLCKAILNYAKGKNREALSRPIRDVARRAAEEKLSYGDMAMMREFFYLSLNHNVEGGGEGVTPARTAHFIQSSYLNKAFRKNFAQILAIEVAIHPKDKDPLRAAGTSSDSHAVLRFIHPEDKTPAIYDPYPRKGFKQVIRDQREVAMYERATVCTIHPFSFRSFDNTLITVDSLQRQNAHEFSYRGVIGERPVSGVIVDDGERSFVGMNYG